MHWNRHLLQEQRRASASHLWNEPEQFLWSPQLHCGQEWETDKVQGYLRWSGNSTIFLLNIGAWLWVLQHKRLLPLKGLVLRGHLWALFSKTPPTLHTQSCHFIGTDNLLQIHFLLFTLCKNWWQRLVLGLQVHQGQDSFCSSKFHTQSSRKDPAKLHTQQHPTLNSQEEKNGSYNNLKRN